MDDKEDFDADRSIQSKQWLQSHYVQHPTECIRVVLKKAVLQQWLLNPINTVKIISFYFSDVLAKDSENITTAQLVFYQAKACLWASLDVVPKSTSVSRLRKSHWEMESTHCSTHCTYLWNCREILHKNNLHQLYTGCFTHACISLSFYSIRSFTCKSTLPDWGLQHTVETDAKRIIFQGLLFQTKRTSCCCCCCIFWMEWRVCKFLTGTKM